jgi:hypothetical protein
MSNEQRTTGVQMAGWCRRVVVAGKRGAWLGVLSDGRSEFGGIACLVRYATIRAKVADRLHVTPPCGTRTRTSSSAGQWNVLGTHRLEVK